MASISDKITDVRNAARPNSARVSSGRSAGGTTLSCDNLAGWPTASKVHFVTYTIDSNTNPISGTQLDCVGIRSGNDITTFTVIDGTDNGNTVNDVVEMLPTAAWAQDLADALTAEHGRTGLHNAASAITIGKLLFPIGSIYTNASDNTNPGTLLGFGTWTAFGTGRVLVGIDTVQTEFDTIGETGGEKTHILTTAEMPAHTHTRGVSGTSGGFGLLDNAAASSSGNIATGSTGGDGAHNNLQPYITVYMWKRTA